MRQRRRISMVGVALAAVCVVLLAASASGTEAGQDEAPPTQDAQPRRELPDRIPVPIGDGAFGYLDAAEFTTPVDDLPPGQVRRVDDLTYRALHVRDERGAHIGWFIDGRGFVSNEEWAAERAAGQNPIRSDPRVAQEVITSE